MDNSFSVCSRNKWKLPMNHMLAVDKSAKIEPNVFLRKR